MYKNLKRIAAVGVALAMMLSSITINASAGSEKDIEVLKIAATPDYTMETINIVADLKSPKAEYANVTVSIKVTNNDRIVYINDGINMANNNQLSFSFKAPDLNTADGLYKVMIAGDYYMEVPYVFSTYAAETRANAIPDIKAQVTAENMDIKLRQYKDLYGYNLEDYSKSSELTTAVANSMISAKESLTDANIRKIFGEMLVLRMLDTGFYQTAEFDVLEKYEKSLGITAGKDSKYSKLSDKSKVYNAILANTSSFEVVKDVFSKTVEFLYFTENETTVTQLSALVELFNSSINSSILTKYKGLSPYDANEVLRTVRSGNMRSYADFVGVFEAAVNGIGTSSAGGSSGGGGGGGSGGSGSSDKQNSYIDASDKHVIGVFEGNTMQSIGGFTDLADAAWAADAITVLYKNGIVAGMGNGLFEPNVSVTREQYVKMLMVAFDVDVAEDVDFADVAEDSWAAPYIAGAVKAGLVYGIDENNFGYGVKITRQDLSVMTKRFAAYKGIELEESEKVQFVDFEQISEYAKSSVNAMHRSGVISGYEDNSFRPYDNSTRAMAAKVIYEVVKGGI